MFRTGRSRSSSLENPKPHLPWWPVPQQPPWGTMGNKGLETHSGLITHLLWAGGRGYSSLTFLPIIPKLKFGYLTSFSRSTDFLIKLWEISQSVFFGDWTLWQMPSYGLPFDTNFTLRLLMFKASVGSIKVLLEKQKIPSNVRPHHQNVTSWCRRFREELRGQGTVSFDHFIFILFWSFSSLIILLIEFHLIVWLSDRVQGHGDCSFVSFSFFFSFATVLLKNTSYTTPFTCL